MAERTPPLITQNETAVRLGFFFGVFILMALLETAFPRKEIPKKWARWPSNISMTLINSLVMKVVTLVLGFELANIAQVNNFGLFNTWSVPFVAEVVLSIVILDMIIYFQHRLFHKIPILWRLHRVHHCDPEFDITTGGRFHPIEIVLSAMVKIACVLSLGIHPESMFVFEIVLSSMAIFNHGNYSIPKPLESTLRWFIVTPSMHRIHHSQVISETNSNYGFNVSLWDRLFYSYTEESVSGEKDITIGLKEFQDIQENSRLLSLLAMPFTR